MPHPTSQAPARAAIAASCVAALLCAAPAGWAQTTGDGFGAADDMTGFAVEPEPAEAASTLPFGLTDNLAAARVAAARITGGVGIGAAPDYFGSDDVSFGATGVLRLDYLRLPGGIEFGSVGVPGLVTGFGPRGSVRYIGSRRASNNPELRGLDDVDRTLEVGLGLGYDAEFARAFADVRYGFGGHEGFAGEVGADALLYPMENVIVNLGPRAAWGDGDFMGTYFGISDRESAASNLPAFNASSGFYAVGVEVGARYQFSPAWGVEGRVTYDYLVNDAADSPITDMGSRNQIGGRVMITRSISLGF
jgi:MipA family protein